MEYVYSDQSQINVVGNEYRISTSTTPLWKTVNGHNSQDQILNSDSSEILEDGLPIGTGNVRNRSFAVLAPYSVALLDLNKIKFYNDYDPLLTPTSSLPITFTNPQAPVYDTIKLHLVQGFNFENNKGLVLSVKAKRKDGSTFILCNLVYTLQDSWETLNPSSFFFGGRVYSSYLEVRVLSLYNLIYDYWLGTLTGDTVAERITNFTGIMRDQQISIYFAFASSKTTTDEQEYLTLVNAKAVDIPTRDQFETIAAYIGESTSGDYIEFYATYSGNIIENYILDLNNSGNDYIVLHDLVLSEYVFDSMTSSYSWIQTDQLEISQISNYESPNLYRPIIKNNGAIAFKIDYTVRLYNRNDNTQVWKSSSMISNSASKYGRILKSINLGANPVQTKIYNQNVIKDIIINRISEPVLNNTKYVTSFSTNTNISITSEVTSTLQPNTTSSLTVLGQSYSSGTSSLQIFSNGLGKIHIPDSTNFLKFNLFQNKNGVNSGMNLTGLGDVYIVFTSNLNENIEYIEYPTPYVNKTKGEVVFRISEIDSKKILALTDRTFRLFLQNESGDRTFLYAGNFYNTSEFKQLVTTDKITSLEAQVTNLQSQIRDLTTLTTAQHDTIDSLMLTNTQIQNNMSSLTAANGSLTLTEAQQKEIANSQKQLIINLEKQISNMAAQITTLTSSLNSTMDQLSHSNGLPSTTPKETPKPTNTTKSQSSTESSASTNQSSVKTGNASNMSSNSNGSTTTPLGNTNNGANPL